MPPLGISGLSPLRLTMAAAALLALAGCADTGLILIPEIAGLGAGAGAGVLTANPLIGVGVALGTRIVTREAIDRVDTEHERQVHIAIAAAAGNAPLETPVTWSADPNTLYIALFGHARGHAVALREFGQLVRCREIVYTRRRSGRDEPDTPEAAFVTRVDTAPVDTAPPAQLPAPPLPDPSSQQAVGDPPQPAEDGTQLPPAAPVTVPARGPFYAAVICRGEFGWQWAVSASRPGAP